MDNNQTGLLRAILATVARQTFPPLEIVSIVAPQKNSIKWLKAYNLCDGTLTQAEIAKTGQVDAGDLSKKIKKWIDAGILIRLADGNSERPIHVYPLADDILKGAGK